MIRLTGADVVALARFGVTQRDCTPTKEKTMMTTDAALALIEQTMQQAAAEGEDVVRIVRPLAQAFADFIGNQPPLTEEQRAELARDRERTGPALFDLEGVQA